MDGTSRPAPAWVAARLRQFGTNMHGQPMYRVIWSEDRLRYECGEWRRTYGDGKDRWIVEKWCPPAIYGSREAWESLREPDGRSALGPYPERGDYEWVFTFESPEGVGIQLDGGILDLVCQCIERGKFVTDAQRKAAIDARRKRQEADFEARFADAFAEALGPFGGNPVSGIPSKRTPDDVVLRDIPVKNDGAFSQA